ncbi:MAG: ATP-binding protein [Paludibacteraceae bacterium]
MFKRKIEQLLEEWKRHPQKKPLVVKGCRQCGKTSSVRAFAEAHYKHVVYIDFHEREDLRVLFAGNLSVDYLTMTISASIPDAVFLPHETCLILDEIQDCPRARAALKFFKQDGRYDIICTGSLLGVNGYHADTVQEASIPVGFETIVDMYPMDFEEWLWANHVPQSMIDYLRQALADEQPVPEAVHQRMRQLLREYIIVGGMPEAVRTFFDTHDINQVIAIQRGIVEEYRADMVKYAASEDRARIRECFDSIPRQLAKENKKFTYATVRKGGRSKQYISSLQWIEDAGIIRRCYNLSIPELPLGGNAVIDQFKVYMADTGLFVSMLDDGTQGDILQGKRWAYKGAIYENLIADILGKMGRKLYYFQKESGLEIDFVLRYQDECTLLECKARTGNAKSLSTVLKHPEKYHVYHAIKLGDYNIGRQGALLTLPMYMAFLLE